MVKKRRKSSLRAKLLFALATLVCMVAMWRAWIGFEDASSSFVRESGKKNTSTREKKEEEKEENAAETTREPSAVDEQTTFLGELLTMTKEVDELTGEERKRKTAEFEEKLVGMESQLAGQVDSPFKTKNLNIISLIRHGLEKDQLGETLDAPNEELLENFGIQQQMEPTDYWEDAFARERFGDLFDAYLGPDSMTDTDKSLKQLIADHIGNKDASILHLGSGNSILPHHLYGLGFQDIVNLDASPTVTRKMKTRFQEQYPLMKWEAQDVQKMSFDKSKFDIILEKGLLDTLLPNLDEALDEMGRVIKSTGKLISVTLNGDALEKRFSESGVPCIKHKLGQQKEDSKKKKANPEINNEEGLKILELAEKRGQKKVIPVTIYTEESGAAGS